MNHFFACAVCAAGESDTAEACGKAGRKWRKKTRRSIPTEPTRNMAKRRKERVCLALDGGAVSVELCAESMCCGVRECVCMCGCQTV